MAPRILVGFVKLSSKVMKHDFSHDNCVISVQFALTEENVGKLEPFVGEITST